VHDFHVRLFDVMRTMTSKSHRLGDTTPPICPVQRQDTSNLVDFFTKAPEIHRFPLNDRYGRIRIALLFVKHGQLFEEIDFGSRSSFERVDTLKAGFEAKVFGCKGEWHPPTFWGYNFSDTVRTT
jgi:hypothetical protein